MKILFDQGTPVPLGPFLSGHLIRTAWQEGWDRIENGELIQAAEQGGFDLLLTTDKNIRYQQNLSHRRIAIIVIGKQQWPALRPHVALVVAAVEATTPGSYIELEIP
jgi:hypothetical protein